MSKPFLRLCPWCLSDTAELCETETGCSSITWVVICQRCGAHGPHKTLADNKDYAVERWNAGGVRADAHEGFPNG